MATGARSPLSIRALTPASLWSLLRDVYARAPASVGTIASLAATWLLNRAYEDYRVWMSLGPGGIFPHSAFGWLMHNITVLPISLSATIRRSVRFLPLPEEGREPFFLRDVLQLRDGERPVTKGVAPHRCLEQRITATIEDEDQLAKDITSHLELLHKRHPSLLSHDTSEIEAADAPALFHIPSAACAPSPLSTFYFSMMPRREIVHFHRIDGSLHCLLSPADARHVIAHKWGELHPLSGLGFVGYYFPPFVRYPALNRLLCGMTPSMVERRRWGHYPPVLTRATQAGASAATRKNTMQKNKGGAKMTKVPPTYVMIYPPTNENGAKQVTAIIDASVSFAIGFDINRYHVDEAPTVGSTR